LPLSFPLHCFGLLAARLGVFVSHPERSETKRLNGRQDGTTTVTRRSPEWQGRPVTKLLLDFGAQPALIRRDGPERFVRRVQRG
jgi:hypothetical protein